MRPRQHAVGRRCTVCTHPAREAIDTALVSDTVAVRAIACQYGVGRESLRRHRANHLASALAKGTELADAAQAGLVQRVAVRVAEQREIEDARHLNLYGELAKLFTMVGKMMDACDRYLTDPNDPSRYDLNPRAHELEVTYLVRVGRREDGSEIVATRKALLSELMGYFDDKVPDARGLLGVKWKVTDPRRLVLEAARRLEGQQRWLTDLLAKVKGEGVDLEHTEEWRTLRGKILAALAPYPEARLALAAALGDEPKAPVPAAGTGAEQAL